MNHSHGSCWNDCSCANGDSKQIFIEFFAPKKYLHKHKNMIVALEIATQEFEEWTTNFF